MARLFYYQHTTRWGWRKKEFTPKLYSQYLLDLYNEHSVPRKEE